LEEVDLKILPIPVGTSGIIEKIRQTVGDRPVYLSIDVSRACILC
jgi:hypothetical protein